ncbi:MAG: FAD-binding protein [Proteobacteria bacterium]|nr:FAD-binding protein [Pseudomonadota bacterium]
MAIKKTDVLVIGAGGAGIFAAVTASKMGAGVIIISKEPSGYGDTRISLGAMCKSAEGVFDSKDKFVEDMIEGGKLLNNPKLVNTLADEATDAVISMEDYGHIFRRNRSGKLKSSSLKLGGHRFSRTILSPSFGVSMGQTIRSGLARSGVLVMEETVCTELIVENDEVIGALALYIKTGESLAILAKSVVVASGGGGALYYPHTDCMPYVTGDSYSLSLAAGAELIDMEQVQFLPFSVTHPKSMEGILCGEHAMARPFGKLLNNNGRVVLKNFHRMTRAEVAMIMMKEIKNGGATEHGGLVFDVSTNMKIPILRTIYKNQMYDKASHFLKNIRKAYGKNAAEFKEPWDVLPTAHYFMGGVKTDEFCRSNVKGLYSCGQAQGGVMGGNRLGATSLTEVFVFGKRAGVSAAEDAVNRSFGNEDAATEPMDKLNRLFGRTGLHSPIKLKKRIRELMWEYAGPLRDGQGLTTALNRLTEVKKDAEELTTSSFKRYNTEVIDAIELSHMISSSEAVIQSALKRKETRGAHARSDFPNMEETVSPKNIVVQKLDGELVTTSKETH